MRNCRSFPAASGGCGSPEVDARLALLKKWREGKAKQLEIDPGVLINNALLEELARRLPRQEAELAEVPGLKDWQRRELGPEIILQLAGKGA